MAVTVVNFGTNNILRQNEMNEMNEMNVLLKTKPKLKTLPSISSDDRDRRTTVATLRS